MLLKLPKCALINVLKIRRVTSPKLPKHVLIDVPKIRRVTSPKLPKRVLITCLKQGCVDFGNYKWNISPDGVESKFFCWFGLVLTRIQLYCAHIRFLHRCRLVHRCTLRIMITNMERSLCFMILRLQR
jgi:hypothetical protein